MRVGETGLEGGGLRVVPEQAAQVVKHARLPAGRAFMQGRVPTATS
jgi:hypothetical protein